MNVDMSSNELVRATLQDTRIYERTLSDVGAEDYDNGEWEEEHRYFVAVGWGRKFNGLFLDFGCGTGLVSKNLVSLGCEVIGTDISRNMCVIARNRYKLQVVVADGLHLPFRDHAFSVVCASGVLHHLLQQLDEAFTEMGRCSKKAICIVEPSSTPPLFSVRILSFFNKVYEWCMFQMINKHAQGKYTYSIYEGPIDPKTLEGLCMKHGFKVAGLRFFNHIPKLRMIPREEFKKHLINSLISQSHGTDVEIVAVRS